MPRLMQSIEVRVSPNKVRDYIWDVEALPSYMPVSRVQVEQPGQSRRKLRMDFDYGDGPIAIASIAEINEAGRKIKLYATEGMTLEQTWVLQQIVQGCKITYIVDYEPVPQGLLGMLRQGRSRKRMYQMCHASLERLRYHLERQADGRAVETEKARNLAA